MTPLEGIVYYPPPDGAVLSARDGRVNIPYGDIPIPLLKEDFLTLEGDGPSYDAVGRGLFQALRMHPGCRNAARYAAILAEGYPHIVSDVATQILMLGEKEVDLPYLERRVTLLRILALMEPGNARVPLEAGKGCLELALDFSGLQGATRNLFLAQALLQQALDLTPGETEAMVLLAEVSATLGHYDRARELWEQALPLVPAEGKAAVERGIAWLNAGQFPRVPSIDYLQAVGEALEIYQQGEHEETAAMLADIFADAPFAERFPMPEVRHVLGCCYEKMAMPKYAEECYEEALRLDPTCGVARSALQALRGGS